MTDKCYKNRTAACVLGAVAAALLLAGMLTGCSDKPDKYELRSSGIELYNSGDYQGAIEAFDAALDASDGQVSELQYDILKYRGECELRLGDYSAAKTTYNALVEVCDDEDSAGILDELGALDSIKAATELMDSGSYSEAYTALEQYAQLDGTLTGKAAVYNRAVCAEHMGNFDEAYELFTAYLAMYPDDENAAKEAAFCKTR